MKVRAFLTQPLLLTTVMFFGLLVALFCALRLRFAYPFRLLFFDTCIYTPDEEVGALLVVFSTSLGLATISFVTMLRRYEGLRRFTFRFLIAMITFGFGVFVTT